MRNIFLAAFFVLASCAMPDDSQSFEELKTVVLSDSDGDRILIRSRPQNFLNIEKKEISMAPSVGPVLISLNSKDRKNRDIVTGVHEFPLHDFKIRLVEKRLIQLETDFIEINILIEADALKIASFKVDVGSNFSCTYAELKRKADEAREAKSDSATSKAIRDYQKSLVFYVVNFGRPKTSESDWFVVESDASASPSLLALSEKLYGFYQDGNVKYIR